MAKVVQTLKLKEKIEVDGLTIELGNDPKGTITEILKHDNGSLKKRVTDNETGISITSKIEKKYNKLVWQKAQQQQ